MSWQGYVDNNLVGTGHVQQAAILGLDGSTWATSDGFTIDAAEAKLLVRHLKEGPANAQANGIFVNKIKYFCLKLDDNLLIGKKGTTGVFLYKTTQALVVAVYGEGTQPGNCNNIVSNLGKYLQDVGF